MNYLTNALKHLRRTIIHKYWVFHYSCLCGIPFTGLIHDLSKFSPTEFFESVQFYDDKVSPITLAKKKKGYSNAWLHHKGRNKHHQEYWIDIINGEYVTHIIPLKYQIEMLCDHLAAARSYNNIKCDSLDTFFKSELSWWKKHKDTCIMHPVNILFLDSIYKDLSMFPTAHKGLLRKSNLKRIYNRELERLKFGGLNG